MDGLPSESLSRELRETIFEDYFHIFPWNLLPPGGGIGIGVECGIGQWSIVVAPHIVHFHLLGVNPEALAVAWENLKAVQNVSFHANRVGDIPLPSRSLDYEFSRGVLLHVPDTQDAIRAAAEKLKPGEPYLIYLYYAFENRSLWYRLLWAMSNGARIVLSRLAHPIRKAIGETITALICWPLARLAELLKRLGLPHQSLPLSWYSNKLFVVLRTDSYDRFCTQLEKRFSKPQIECMLANAGFSNVVFSDSPPYWCAVGIKSP